MVAESILKTEKILPSVYSKRASSTDDLYKHISDFDHVGMYSYPASIEIKIFLDRRYLIDNAISYNDDYKKVVIPRDTVFFIGKYKFGIYYPIEIQINKTTDSINVIYDTSVSNPLYTLGNNAVPFASFTYGNLEVLSIDIPIFQFERTVVTDDLISDYGYSNTYTYLDKFYALRAYTYINNTYQELSYTLSEDIYDVQTPTLKIKLYPEDNKIKLSLPQIYFTTGVVGSKIEIVLFTTKGVLDVDISEVTPELVTANFSFDSRDITQYSSILANIPTIILQPISTKIAGGTDGYTYEQLRSYIINDTLHETVPVTPIGLESFFAKRGLRIYKQVDNITERIYYAYKTLTDSFGTILPVVNSTIKLTNTTENVTSSIIRNIDESITILPTTIFDLSEVAGYYTPLTDEQVSSFNSLPATNRTAILNTYRYVRSPHHIRIVTKNQYPRAESYNLMNPACSDLRFIKDNITMSAQMTVTSMLITHDAEGSGGYTLRLGALKEAIFTDTAEEDILVYLTTATSTDLSVGLKATYVGELSGLSVYEIYLGTNYHINENNELCITTLETIDGNVREHYVPMEITFNIIIGIASTAISNVTYDSSITYGIPSTYSGYIGSSRQSFKCKFGNMLSTTILNNLNINWSQEEYEVYPEDIYETYREDVYETNQDGTLVIDLSGETPVLNKLHSEGDIVYDGDDPIVKYYEGEIKLVDGEPILSKSREIEYFVDSMLFDMVLFVTDDVEYTRYYEHLPILINDYLTIVGEAGKHLLERTNVYFRPTNTMGLGTFAIGDKNTITIPLDLSFAIKIYIYPYVYSDVNLLEIITTKTESIVSNSLEEVTISMVAISNKIKEELADYVVAVDVGGINNNVTLQTLISTTKHIRPTVRRSLVYEDGKFSLIKDIVVTFATNE